jgi:aminoglycoside 3-N-acetyltransferase
VPGHDHAAASVRRGMTKAQLVRDLRRLGVTQGQTLLVHASLRSIGLVDGGAPTVVTALREAVGPTGNVVAPTGTEENSLTSRAHKARIACMTQDEIEAFCRDMSAFDKNAMPTTMGAIGEALRTAGGAVRSAHPQSSFAAVGPRADDLMAGHRLECHLGEDSSLAKLYQLGAHVLMLGVGYARCTAFHLAEYRYAENPPMRTYSCVIVTNGRKRWETFEDVVLDDREFEMIGESTDREISVKRGHVGKAESRLMPMIQVVEHAVAWMSRRRA